MRWLLVALMVIHGLIHFMGPAKAFDLAELPQLAQPISRPMGVAWAVAGAMMLVAALQLVRSPASWWIPGLAAVILSQAVVLSAWSDARFGTLANLVVLAAVVYGFASRGPLSFRAEYERQVARRLSDLPAAETLTEQHLDELPAPVRRYVAASGAVGRPRPRHFTATWKGRIRSNAEDSWMEFTAEQHNFLDEPSRFFLMDAKRSGLPVDVYHDFSGGHARMRVRLLSLIPLVDASGAEMDRAESVTLFNDIALFAPGGLADPAMEWEPVDDRTARGRFSRGAVTVTAVLHFDGGDELVDFVSDDRMAAVDGGELVPQRWSTPVSAYEVFDGLRVVSRGEGRWHPEGADDFAYIELEMVGYDSR